MPSASSWKLYDYSTLVLRVIGLFLSLSMYLFPRKWNISLEECEGIFQVFQASRKLCLRLQPQVMGLIITSFTLHLPQRCHFGTRTPSICAASPRKRHRKLVQVRFLPVTHQSLPPTYT